LALKYALISSEKIKKWSAFFYPSEELEVDIFSSQIVVYVTSLAKIKYKIIRDKNFLQTCLADIPANQMF
jgi:hypothetical protein